MKELNLVGQKFKKLLVVSKEDRHPKGGTQWLCLCDCGVRVVVRAVYLRQGSTGSCGCSTSAFMKEKRTTHGLSRTPVYKVWRAMHDRCTNPKNKTFKYHGARGIAVCKRWLKFENFIADMGDRPEGATLERKNNNRGYTPANCCWATPSEQQNNRRVNRVLTFRGEQKTLAQWADVLGQPRLRVWQRLNRGWSVERALTEAKRVPHTGKVVRIKP